MGKVNYNRVLLGGFVAAMVGNALGVLVDGVMLGPWWAKEFVVLGRTSFSINWVNMTLLSLGNGVFEIWLYAAIRPRYGAGPRTAIYAGTVVWVLCALIPNIAIMGSSGLFTPMLVFWTTVGGYFEWAIAALAGAALYKEADSGSQSMAASA